MNERLIEILRDVTTLDSKCKHTHSDVPVPPIIYKRLAQLREEVGQWVLANLVQDKTDGS